MRTIMSAGVISVCRSPARGMTITMIKLPEVMTGPEVGAVGAAPEPDVRCSGKTESPTF
jgi:hypothetical protein